VLIRRLSIIIMIAPKIKRSTHRIMRTLYVGNGKPFTHPTN